MTTKQKEVEKLPPLHTTQMPSGRPASVNFTPSFASPSQPKGRRKYDGVEIKASAPLERRLAQLEVEPLRTLKGKSLEGSVEQMRDRFKGGVRLPRPQALTRSDGAIETSGETGDDREATTDHKRNSVSFSKVERAPKQIVDNSTSIGMFGALGLSEFASKAALITLVVYGAYSVINGGVKLPGETVSRNLFRWVDVFIGLSVVTLLFNTARNIY